MSGALEPSDFFGTLQVVVKNCHSGGRAGVVAKPGAGNIDPAFDSLGEVDRVVVIHRFLIADAPTGGDSLEIFGSAQVTAPGNRGSCQRDI